MNTVLITGASGFVGRALWTALRGRGCVVRAALREQPTFDLPPGAQASDVVRTGDIGPETDWAAALTGCNTVVHLAARAHMLRDRSAGSTSAIRRVNVEGTDNLARRAARAGVYRFVFLSSVKVNGERTADRPFNEEAPIAPADAYGTSKAEAEDRLKEIAADTGMEVVILRPPLVYGPGVKANFLSLLKAVDVGLPLPLLSINNRRSLVYVGNLVSAIEVGLTHPAAANRAFFVSDDNDVSTPELIRCVADALGKKPRLFSFPPQLLRGVGRLAGSRDQVARLTESLQVDVSRIKTELGWTPRFALRQGLVETATWYRSTFS